MNGLLAKAEDERDSGKFAPHVGKEEIGPAPWKVLVGVWVCALYSRGSLILDRCA